jgi:regulatory protein
MTYEQALNKAAAWCSKAERATRDVLDKLRVWEVSEADAARIIQWLTDEGFLSEARYVHAFVNDKLTYDHWGRIKIRYALQQKGVSPEQIALAFDEQINEEQYLGTLVDLLKGKMRGMKQPLDRNDRAKLYRFAASRGFETAVCSQALQRMEIGEEDEE